MAHYESPNWTGPPPPPPRSARMAFADWFARWGFALLTIFFLVLVGAAMYLLPGLRSANGPGTGDGSVDLGTLVAPTTPASRPVYVSISTVPAGARVEIDVDSVGVTPLYLVPVERSVHLLTLELDGFRRVDTLLYNQESDTSSYLFVLSPEGDANVAAVDEQPSGGATEQVRDQPVTTERTNRRQVEPPVRAQPRTEEARPPAAIPTHGGLTVSSTPLGATVFLDGVDIGTTPTSLGDVDPGAHEVILRLEGHDEYSRRVSVTAGQSTVVQATLSAAAGELAILVQPWGSIYIDGRLVKRDVDIEFRTSVPAGEHAIVASHPSLGRITRTIRVLPGRSKRIVFDLNQMNVSESEN